MLFFSPCVLVFGYSLGQAATIVMLEKTEKGSVLVAKCFLLLLVGVFGIDAISTQL